MPQRHLHFRYYPLDLERGIPAQAERKCLLSKSLQKDVCWRTCQCDASPFSERTNDDCTIAPRLLRFDPIGPPGRTNTGGDPAGLHPYIGCPTGKLQLDRIIGTVTVHGLAGDWSIFRREITFYQTNVGRKHGPVPFPRREGGDSPIFAAVKHFPNTTPLVPRKSGQSPVNGYSEHAPPCPR
jgi:hypothetical protein